LSSNHLTLGLNKKHITLIELNGETLTVQELLRQFTYKTELVASQLKQLFCYGKFSLSSNHLTLGLNKKHITLIELNGEKLTVQEEKILRI